MIYRRFGNQSLLSNLCDLAATIGLSCSELRTACEWSSWIELRIEPGGRYKFQCGSLHIAGNVHIYPEQPRDGRDFSRWGCCSFYFLRLFNLYESSKTFPRPIVGFFRVLDRALRIDVGTGDVNEFYKLHLQVGTLCAEYEYELQVNTTGLKKTSRIYDVKLRNLVRQMWKVSRRRSLEEDDDVSCLKRQILQSVKGGARIGILQLVYDLVVHTSSL